MGILEWFALRPSPLGHERKLQISFFCKLEARINNPNV